MIIRKFLEEINRYDDIKEILNTIINDYQYRYLINTFFVEDAKWQVYGEDVRKEASKLLHLFDDNLEYNDDREKDYLNLRQYISTKVCSLLYNFALSISYGDIPTVNIKDIRSWQILNYILYNLNDVSSWTIPNCWKAEK